MASTNRPKTTEHEGLMLPEEFDKLLDPNVTHFHYGRDVARSQYRTAFSKALEFAAAAHPAAPSPQLALDLSSTGRGDLLKRIEQLEGQLDVEKSSKARANREAFAYMQQRDDAREKLKELVASLSRKVAELQSEIEETV